MGIKNKILSFKLKIGFGILVLLLTVGSFIAANTINEIGVEDTESGNISVEFKDADINDVFRVLALKGNVSIVADPDVKGLVTVQITDVSWERVLDVICRTYGYAYEREANIIRVTTLGKQGQENLITEVFALNYAKATDVATAVSEMRSDRGKIRYDSRSNLVIVTDIPTNIYKIGKVIDRLDTITPQVTIEAKIIEVTLNDDQDLGIKWNASYSANMSKRPTTFPWPANNVGKKLDNYMPKGNKIDDFPTVSQPAFKLGTADDFNFGILDGSAFTLLLEAIQTNSKTTILSNPRITTLDNEPAQIHVGTSWPIANYSYNEETDRFVITGWDYKSYGILLKVTPTINKNGYITLKLHPEISDKQEEIDFQGARVPVLTTQTTDATVMIKDGHTLVIGGLLKNKKVMTKTKVPFLGDIPILGLLFTHKSEQIVKKDLLIFITPHIISEQTLQKHDIATVLDSSISEISSELAQKEEIEIEDIISEEEPFLDEEISVEDTGEEIDSSDKQAMFEEPVEVLEETTLVDVLEQTQEQPITEEEIPEDKSTFKKEQEQNKGFIFRK